MPNLQGRPQIKYGQGRVQNASNSIMYYYRLLSLAYSFINLTVYRLALPVRDRVQTYSQVLYLRLWNFRPTSLLYILEIIKATFSCKHQDYTSSTTVPAIILGPWPYILFLPYVTMVILICHGVGA